MPELFSEENVYINCMVPWGDTNLPSDTREILDKLLERLETGDDLHITFCLYSARPPSLLVLTYHSR
jgi:hypothetical protein